MKRKGTREISGVTPFLRLRYGKSAPVFPVPCKNSPVSRTVHRFRIYFPFCRVRYDDNVRTKTIFQCSQTVLKAHDCHGSGKNDKGQEKGKHEESRRPQRPAGQIPPGRLRLRSMGGLFLHDAAPEKEITQRRRDHQYPHKRNKRLHDRMALHMVFHTKMNKAVGNHQ